MASVFNFFHLNPASISPKFYQNLVRILLDTADELLHQLTAVSWCYILNMGKEVKRLWETEKTGFGYFVVLMPRRRHQKGFFTRKIPTSKCPNLVFCLYAGNSIISSLPPSRGRGTTRSPSRGHIGPRPPTTPVRIPYQREMPGHGTR